MTIEATPGDIALRLACDSVVGRRKLVFEDFDPSDPELVALVTSKWRNMRIPILIQTSKRATAEERLEAITWCAGHIALGTLASEDERKFTYAPLKRGTFPDMSQSSSELLDDTKPSTRAFLWSARFLFPERSDASAKKANERGIPRRLAQLRRLFKTPADEERLAALVSESAIAWGDR